MAESTSDAVTGSDTFDQHVRAAPPEWLFHYTGQKGLLNIVKTGELWATKAQYMNDATEFRLALSIAEERIDEAVKKAEGREREHLRALRSATGIKNINLFVACFCEDRDLLSQWRGYSGESHGYSLGMHVPALREWARKSDLMLAKCIYDKRWQEKIVDQLIARALREPHNGIDLFRTALVRVGAFFKSESFRDEREWRIASGITSIMHSMVGFKEGRSMVVPYLRVRIGEGRESAIGRAVIGPCPHSELAAEALIMLFMQHGISRQDLSSRDHYLHSVESSTIPYRNW